MKFLTALFALINSFAAVFIVHKLFVNADVLRTDGAGRSTTYGATATTSGGCVLVSVDNTNHFGS